MTSVMACTIFALTLVSNLIFCLGMVELTYDRYAFPFIISSYTRFDHIQDLGMHEYQDFGIS